MDSNFGLFTYKPPAPGTAAYQARALEKTNEAANGFESMFMSQMMQFMWTDVQSNEIFGGGHGEDVWRGMLVQEFGSIASKAGGLGIADQVKAELLKLQEQQGLITASAAPSNNDNVKEIAQ